MFDSKQFLEYYKRVNHFAQENGEELTVHAPGDVSIRMPILDRHLSSPKTAHGGALAGFMDSLLGAAALTKSLERGMLCATVEFKINYYTPAHLGEVLVGKASIVHEGRSLITTVADVFLEDETTRIAGGNGTFNVYPFDKKKDLFEGLL